MSQESTIQAILNKPIVPVFYHKDLYISLNVFHSAYKGGVRVFEFTNRGANAFEQFKTLVAEAKQYSDYTVGIGTILNERDAENFIEAGAQFVVSPCFVEGVGDICYQNKIPYLPGCMTVKEIFLAMETGCGMVKVFPGEVVGTAFVKAVKAVLPNVKLMITGGVEPNAASLAKWFEAGSDAVGIGSQLFKKDWLQNNEFDKIEDICRENFAFLSRQN